MQRRADLIRFYLLLDALARKLRGKRSLETCSGRMLWPPRGVYFFFEDGEVRSDTGASLRVVRVGTHALQAKSASTLWGRLAQHRGAGGSGGGNHRGSIFRLLVGTAIGRRGDSVLPETWGKGSTADSAIRAGELGHEKRVSSIIRRLPFLWLDVPDEPGPSSLRGLVERNSIALLSNFGQPALDPPSAGWLGRFCDRERVRMSGLWNQNHVEERHDSNFLDVFEALIAQMEAAR